jgi:hypothetical protein
MQARASAVGQLLRCDHVCAESGVPPIAAHSFAASPKQGGLADFGPDLDAAARDLTGREFVDLNSTPPGGNSCVPRAVSTRQRSVHSSGIPALRRPSYSRSRKSRYAGLSAYASDFH